VEEFGSAPELLRSELPDMQAVWSSTSGCLDWSAWTFKSIAKANIHIPIVFMTAHCDIPMSITALKGWSIELPRVAKIYLGKTKV
jgi:FixJ family two-component response regulator